MRNEPQMRGKNMEWKQVIDGCRVKFDYSEPIGYFFKIYLGEKEVYDSDGLQDTDNPDSIVRAAERVIRDELPTVI